MTKGGEKNTSGQGGGVQHKEQCVYPRHGQCYEMPDPAHAAAVVNPSGHCFGAQETKLLAFILLTWH